MVLSRYSADVVKAVTEPVSGLPSRKNEHGWSGMPDIADVKAACEEEAAKQDRWRKMQGVRPVDRVRLPPPPRDPKAQANTFVPKGFIHYDAMLERHEREGKDSLAWFETRVCFDKVERHGIWVPFPWMSAPAPAKKGPKLYTSDEIIARYRKQPEPQHEAAE